MRFTGFLHSLSLVALVLGGASVGCALPTNGSPPGEEGAGKGDTFNPAFREPAALLRVETPAIPEGLSLYPLTVEYQGQAIELDTNVAVGTDGGCLVLKTDSHQQTRCGLGVAEGETKVVRLAGVGFDWAPDSLEVDVGPEAFPLKVAEQSDDFSLDPRELAPGHVLPVLPGAYVVVHNEEVLPSVELAANAGEFTKIDLTPEQDPRVIFDVHAAPKASDAAGNELPGATPRSEFPDCFLVDQHFVASWSGGYSPDAASYAPHPENLDLHGRALESSESAIEAHRGDATLLDYYRIDLRAGGDGSRTGRVRFFPFSSNSDRFYVYEVNGQHQRVSTVSGERIEVEFGRLHVNDVCYDGGLPVRGTYTVIHGSVNDWANDTDVPWLELPRFGQGPSCSGGDVVRERFVAYTYSGLDLARRRYTANVSFNANGVHRELQGELDLTGGDGMDGVDSCRP